MIFFINFPGTATSCEAIQFADDSIIFVSDKNVDGIEFMLNEELKSVYYYFVKYKLEILKHMKSNVCSLACLEMFRLFRNQLKLYYNHTKVYVADSHKYLDFVISS